MVRGDALSRGDQKKTGKDITRVFIGGPVMFAGVAQPDNLYAAQRGRMLFKEHYKSYQVSTTGQEGGRVMWEQASIVFTGPIYCCYPLHCVIIQWSGHQITLGTVTPSCIRFTALYIHLLSCVKNGGLLNNWIE